MFSRPRGSLKPAATPKWGPKGGVSEEPTHPLGFLPPPRPLRPANRGGREMPVMPRPLRPANDANGGGRDGRAPEPCHHSPKGRYPAPQGEFLRFQGLFCCSPKGPFPGPARCRRATAAGADGGNDGDGADGGCRGLRERPSGGGAPTRRGRWGRRSLQARSGGARGSRWGGDGDGGVTIPNPDCEPLIPNP